MRIRIYAPTEYHNALMYEDTDKSVEKIIGDDILNIVNKSIDMGDDHMITYVDIHVENHILNTLDPVYPISYGRYIINIHLIDIYLKSYELKYSLETEAMLYPKKGKGIENDNSGETIIDHEDSIEFTRYLYQIYNFTLNKYLRDTFIDRYSKREKVIGSTILSKYEKSIDVKPKRIDKIKRYKGPNNGNNYRHKNKKK